MHLAEPVRLAVARRQFRWRSAGLKATG